MKQNILLYGLTAVLLSGISPARADVTCTATPDCTTLGYTKSASDCPNGGVKCPFNNSKMFCLKSGGGVEFSIKNAVKTGDIVYSDGTTSASYTYSTTKIPIGVALVTETNSAYNHGIIFQLDQPLLKTRTEAVTYCSLYATAGTSEGDWKLPTLYEMMYLMGWETATNKVDASLFNDINYALQRVPDADAMGWMCSFFYNSYAYSNYPCPNYYYTPTNTQTDCGGGTKTILNGSSTSNAGSGYCVSYFQFWLTDETQNAKAYYVPYVNASGGAQNNKIITNTNKTRYSTFRCVLRF